MANEMLEKGLNELVDKIAKDKPRATDEQKTTNWLVNPFLKTLGYSIDNGIVEPQYDVSDGKDNKVDYAIVKNNKPIVLIEIKKHTENLDKHFNQLHTYFNVCAKCSFGILTNGVEYRFFSNTENVRDMDSTPFMMLNLESEINSEMLEILELFKCENLQNNIAQIRNRAESMLDKIAIKNFLKTNIINPSDEFAKFVLKHIKGTQHTKKASEFKAHITRIFGEIMANIPLCETQDYFKTQKNENPLNSKERQAFNIVCEILANEIVANGVNLTLGKRTTNYIPVEIEGGKYICGIWNNCLAISIPNKEHKFGYERFKIENINDIYKYKNELIKSLKMRLK